MGYQASPLLWKKVARGLSAGRVQSVAVRLIVDREKAVAAFEPDEYWTIEANVEGSEVPPFAVKLAKVKGKAVDAVIEQAGAPGARTLPREHAHCPHPLSKFQCALALRACVRGTP